MGNKEGQNGDSVSKMHARLCYASHVHYIFIISLYQKFIFMIIFLGS